MISNLERYKKDLSSLLNKGGNLHNAIQRECFDGEYDAEVKKQLGEKAEAFLKEIPSFTTDYQAWYSEAKALIRQLLPDRLSDFVRHYEKPKSRKDITNENYTIEDYLQGFSVMRDGTEIVKPSSAIPHFVQQLAILKAVNTRFESSLFDIQTLVQADLFNSEIDSAKELLKHKFTRAAGALAGVVLEHHLSQVCVNHNVKVTVKNPSIATYNDALKNAGVIDTPTWRSIQLLGDIRNLCDHDKTVEPTQEQINDLIIGANKITKTIY